MKGLGHAPKILGMRVTRDGGCGYLFDQKEAIVNLLEIAACLMTFPLVSPLVQMYTRFKLMTAPSLDTSASGQPNVHDSQSIVGSFLWVA